MLEPLLQGLIIGFSIAAPVGPIGVLCIRRAAADGMGVGFATGMGAATADAFYGVIAAFGLTAISAALIEQQFWLGLVGGLFLAFLGVRTLLSKPAQTSRGRSTGSLLNAYFSTLGLTLSNPATILSFVAVFAGLGLVQSASYLAAGAMVAGVFLGSALWWLLLSASVGLLRARIGTRGLRNVNRFSGAVLLAFGVLCLWRVFRPA